MTIHEERDYYALIEKGVDSMTKAENYYENKSYNKALKSFYHAALSFEMAKEIAAKTADTSLRIEANTMEFYCLEKIDELSLFKKAQMDDLSK